MEDRNDEKINSNFINPNNTCRFQNGDIICEEYPLANLYNQNYKEYNSIVSNQKYSDIIDNENSENNNKVYQEISSKRFNNKNKKNNISNFDSTFSQTFKTLRYEPLSYCLSQDSILNSNLNQTSKTNFSNNKNDEKSLTYYNYDKEQSNEDYIKIFKNENNKEEKGIIFKSPIVNNYIEQIRHIYEKEQNNIRLENYQLQKKLTRNKDENERKINYLTTTINNIKSQNEKDVKNLIKENEFELKKVLNKKDYEINVLSNRNFELEQANDDLVEKINQMSNKMNTDTINNRDKIAYYQLEINNISKNNSELKEYYEKKIDYLTRIFAEEKNKLIAAYESHIDELNLGYKKSQKEYINQAQNKDNSLRNIIKNYSTDSNKLNNQINSLKEEIIKLRKEEQEIIKKNIELKKDNDILKENYKNAKREIRFQIKQKEIMEQNNSSTQKEFYKLKAENEKLNRLTYGTFKRSKSKIH